MLAVKLIAALALAYLLVLGLVFALQTSLLFPTRLVGPAGPLPPGAIRLTVAAEGGERLHGIHVPPAALQEGRPAVVLGFAGNAWNGQSAAEYLHELFPQHHVVAFHYRGYRPSEGAPVASALLADAPIIHDHVAERLGTDRIVAVGFSIGSGVAAHLASRRKLAGLILVTPFDSLAAVAADHYRWLPVALLLRHRMEPAEDLRGSAVPTATIAAEHDTLIPARRTEALEQAVPNLVLRRRIAGAGHNDIYRHPAFERAMAEAMARVLEN
ncbi:MAG TPA: alpha/beta fold hydrolase [Allosphingosinicella sp.]|nr:alpha/beta fold hydrolase [Allosphingosinicella sp.]